MTSKTEAVAARLDAVGSASFIDDLKNCKVAEVDSGFSVTPSGDTYAIQGGGPSLNFAVQAGNGTPQATLIGSSVPGVRLTTDANSGIFVVHVAADPTTPGGETQLLLSDSTGRNRKIVTITVDKAPASTAATATPTSSPQSLSPQTAQPSAWEQRSSEAQRKTVQRALNKAGATAADGTTLAEDGVIGLRTREAIGAYQKSKGQLPTYVVTPRLFLELKDIDDANPASPVTSPAVPVSPTPVAGGVAGAETPYEKTLLPNDVIQIQTALGIPASRRTRTFNDETRAAIMEFTKPQSTRNLTKEIVDRLLGR